MTLLPACSGDPEISDQNLHRISVEKLADDIDRNPDRILLIDVRSEARFMEGRLPGAIHIPLPALPPSPEQRKDVRRVIVYGQSWTDTLAPAAAKKLMAEGVSDVQVFRGGVEAWLDAGHTLDRPGEPRSQ